MSWNSPASFDVVCRRASGRRAYNALRRDLALFRRVEVSNLLLKYGYRRGVQVRIAARLGVSEATVSRDIKATLYQSTVCPACGSYKPRPFVVMDRQVPS